MELTTEASGTHQVRNADELQHALEALDPQSNCYAILARAEEVYIQTSCRATGFVIEKREGSADRHFEAARLADSNTSDEFTLHETIAIFRSWFNKEPAPIPIIWKPMRFPQHAKWLPWVIFGGFVAAILYVFGDAVWKQIQIIKQIAA